MAEHIDDDCVMGEDEQLMLTYQANRQHRFHIFQNLVMTTASIINEVALLPNDKTPCMTSKQTGDKWVTELLDGHSGRFFDMFRMSKQIFLDLLFLLEESYGLRGSRRTSTREVLGITLYILGHHETMRKTSERFQHSTETVSRYFQKGLRALTQLSMDIIAPIDPQFRDIPSHIEQDERYMPYFKDCIGAIDGTHVDACIPVHEQVAYIGRHGSTTQNVMAVCDFNMCFTYVVPGWEGSAHDSRIYHRVVRDKRCKFPYAPPGKYYLVDAGYPLETGLLKPFPETRYHLPDFARGDRPIEGRREIFNQAHSSLRSVIERSFGVWKNKWRILRKMPQYSFEKQCIIVVATMTLHNYIRRHPSRIDPEFRACDIDENFVHPEAYEHSATNLPTNGVTAPTVETVTHEGTGAVEMSALRDFIAEQLENDRG